MNELDMELEQAMRAFVAAYTSGALDHIPTFVQQFSQAIQPELLDFIEEYLLMEAEPEFVEVPAELLASTAAAAERALSEAMTAAPSLTALRKERGLLPGRLASAVKLPADFFGLLERGEIRLITISPQKAQLLVERLAQALQRTTDEIWMSLRAPAPASAARRMSAQDASTLDIGVQRDFAEALRQSAELTPEMRAEWLDEAESSK
jgi:hypothetical protein